METLSALLAFCAGNSPVTGEFPAQRPMTRSFDFFFDLRLNKRLCKQSWGWWFETPSCPLCRHCSVIRFTSEMPEFEYQDNRVLNCLKDGVLFRFWRAMWVQWYCQYLAWKSDIFCYSINYTCADRMAPSDGCDKGCRVTKRSIRHVL